MKKISAFLAVLLALLCIFTLVGCSEERNSALEEKLVGQMISAIAEKDAAFAYTLFDETQVKEEDFLTAFDEIVAAYQGENVFSVEAKNVRKGYYTVTSGNCSYTVSVSLSGDKLGQFQIFENAVGSIDTLAKNTVWQDLLLMVNLLSLAFTLYSAVDALRHRVPNAILIAFGCVGLHIHSVHHVIAGAYSMSGSVGFYSCTRFLMYPSGNTQLIVSIPAFAILYWLLRRRLLEQSKK